MLKSKFFPFVAAASIASLFFGFNNLTRSDGDKPEGEKLISGLSNVSRVW